MQTDIVSSILQWLNANPEYSWLITFIISASESIAIIGTIIPGSITMTALGALAGSGVIPLWPTVFWAFLGAVVGDGISYWLGHYFKNRTTEIWPFKNNRALLSKGATFFNKYGGMSVFIGRFVGPIRALIPVVAGMMGMKPLPFFVANITSALGWAPAYMLPGILLGAASLELPPDIATRVILILIFWALFILLCLWLIRKIPLAIHQQILTSCQKIWAHLIRTKNPIKKLLRTLLKHHNAEATPYQLRLGFYFILTSAVFIFLASYIKSHGSAGIAFNQSVYHFFRGIYTPEGRDLMIYLTLLGQKQVLLPLACLIILGLALKKQGHLAIHALALMTLTVLSVVFIKNGLQSPRPWGIVHSPESFSFPSGHTTLTTSFYVGLALLLSHAYQGRARQFFYFLIGLIILAVSLSRLYLGAHWFTDVLAGWILSAALLIILTISYNRRAVVFNSKRLLKWVLLGLLLSYSFALYYYLPQFKLNYTQLDYPLQETSLGAFEKQDENFLREQRVSLFGLRSQAINIEWIGDLNTIQKTLLKSHWEMPPEQDWMDVLFRISGVQSAEHLPLISPLYLDKKPSLVLVRSLPDEKKLLVLRLWHSSIILKDGQKPLWVGVIGLVPKTYGWLSRRYKMDIDPTPALLFNQKTPRITVKSILIPMKNHKKKSTQLILLVK